MTRPDPRAALRRKLIITAAFIAGVGVALAIALPLVIVTAFGQSAERYLALAYSSRTVYIVSDGGSRAQCQAEIRGRHDGAVYACVSVEQARRMITQIFGAKAAEALR